MNISVILIHHKYGEDIRIATNKKSEIRQLAKYVKKNWDEEKNGKIPRDQKKMIATHFNILSDDCYETIDFDVRPSRKRNKKPVEPVKELTRIGVDGYKYRLSKEVYVVIGTTNSALKPGDKVRLISGVPYGSGRSDIPGYHWMAGWTSVCHDNAWVIQVYGIKKEDIKLVENQS